MRCDRRGFEARFSDWQDRVDEPGTDNRRDFPDGVEQIAGAAVMAAQSVIELVIEPLIDLLAGLSSRAHSSVPPAHERQSEA
jgi:hypothetical protein